MERIAGLNAVAGVCSPEIWQISSWRRNALPAACRGETEGEMRSGSCGCLGQRTGQNSGGQQDNKQACPDFRHAFQL